MWISEARSNYLLNKQLDLEQDKIVFSKQVNFTFETVLYSVCYAPSQVTLIRVHEFAPLQS